MNTAKSSSHGSHPQTDHHQDAIGLLTADHARVKKLFREFANLKEGNGADEDKSVLVAQICDELEVHTRIEEDIFYPAVRATIGEDGLMDEAIVEHAGARELIAQLQNMNPDDDLYDAKVTVLGEQIQHHVKEEESEMFPKARKAKVDGGALGAQMAERKAELLAETRSDEQTPEAGSRVTRKETGDRKKPLPRDSRAK